VCLSIAVLALAAKTLLSQVATPVTYSALQTPLLFGTAWYPRAMAGDALGSWLLSLAAAGIRGIAPKARIIFLSQYNSSSIAQTALATGALAYVVKSAVSTDLIPAVKSVVEGKTFLSKLD
jgi:hypothetical protein